MRTSGDMELERQEADHVELCRRGLARLHQQRPQTERGGEGDERPGR